VNNTMATRQQQRGFTLIEMLIVMVIIGFSISIVALSIGKPADEEGLVKEARLLMTAIDFVSEQAVLNGEIIAMFVQPKEEEEGKRWCYRWQRYRDGGWQALPDDTLKEYCMPANVQWDLVVEGRVWAYDPELNPQPPLLFFAPSSETTPVEMAIFERGSDMPAQRIEIDMMGNAHWRNQEEADKDNGR